jgi:transposase
LSYNLLTDKEIKILSTNKYVKSVSMNGITFTDEFRLIFINEYENGKLPRQIFEERGFDIDIVGQKRIKSASYRWCTTYKKTGIDGLQDTRKGNSGRPREKELSVEEKYERLKAQNNLLKAENELLKKIKMAERRLGKKK